jgi:molecular chaperone HscA
VARHRLAIDLGTSHTVAVVRRGTDAPRAVLFDGSPLMPSAVFAEPPRLHVGRDAERLALTDPSSFEPHPKRRVDEGSVLLGNAEFEVVELLAALLRRVRDEAAVAGVPAGSGAVLTCPADWGRRRRSVLLTAAQAAGLGDVELVDEPVAAATYCMEVLRQEIGVGEDLAVFDFGGGTLDVSVLRREATGLRVLSVGGLDDLGGVDVDAALVGHVGQLIALRSPRVWQRLNNPGPRSEQRERRQFWSEVRGAKEMLSRTSAAPVQVPGMDNALHLTREELERVAGPLIARAVDETRRVIERSGTTRLAGIFLVGGSSRIPLVAQRLHSRFGVAPTVPEQPELPVAYGGLLVGGDAPVVAPDPTPTAVVTGPPAPPSVSAPPSHVSGPPSHITSGAPQGSYAPPTGAEPTFPVSYPPMQAVTTGSYGAPMVPPTGIPGRAHTSGGPVPHVPPTGIPGRGGAVPPPPRRRRGRVRYIVLAVVLALFVSCGFGGYKIIQFATDAWDSASPDSKGPDGGDGDTDPGSAATLKGAESIALPGGQAAAVTVGGDTVYYATAEATQLKVGAVPAAGGAVKWEVGVALQPAEMTLTVVEDLLIIDGEKAANFAGKNARVTLSTADGAVRMAPREWDDQTYDLAYFGTDALVEVRGFSALAVKRVDLRTGQEKWKRLVGTRSSVINGHHRAEPMRRWPGEVQGAGIPGQGAIFFDPGPFDESIVADPAGVVELTDGTGKSSVIDLNNQVKATGTVPIDDEQWTVYNGVVVGKLTDKEAPGQATIGGYGVGDLKKKWAVPLGPGADVERLKPCGPTQVCVDVSNGSAHVYKTVAIDVSTGTAAWEKPHESADKQNWYVVNNQLLLGNGTFDSISKASVIDPVTGKPIRGLGDGATVVSSAGGRVGLQSPAAVGGKTRWYLTVLDPATGRAIGRADLGGDLPENIVLGAKGAVALTKQKQVLRFAVP